MTARQEIEAHVASIPDNQLREHMDKAFAAYLETMGDVGEQQA